MTLYLFSRNHNSHRYHFHFISPHQRVTIAIPYSPEKKHNCPQNQLQSDNVVQLLPICSLKSPTRATVLISNFIHRPLAMSTLSGRLTVRQIVIRLANEQSMENTKEKKQKMKKEITRRNEMKRICNNKSVDEFSYEN